MIIGTGIDILEISRIEKISSEAFRRKLFTERENEYLIKKGIESTAGYFCAKEAVSKALGTGFAGFQFRDIEILKDNGCPFVVLHANALKIAADKGIDKISLSISHSKLYATAVAIAIAVTVVEKAITEKIVAEEVEVEEIVTICSDTERKTKLNLTTNRAHYDRFPMQLLKKRDLDSHKGDFGKVHVIGGCHEMSGAVTLCSKAVLRSGAGLVTCVIPESIVDRVGSTILEATYKCCEEEDGFLKLTQQEANEIIVQTSVIAFGVGMGKNDSLKEILIHFLRNSDKPMVIDADGLNLLSEMIEVLNYKKAKIVLTPHLGEMSRLTGLEIDEIKKNRFEIAKQFAKEHDVILVLKGNRTTVTDGNRCYENETGNPGMATGGSGDVLTGIIAALIAQGHDVYDAAILGVHIHGIAGDLAYTKHGYGLIASDLIDNLGMLITRS